ncbi:MAG: flagellar biosynthesis protein FlhF, partial [Lacipirellulaceae bacterium]
TELGPEAKVLHTRELNAGLVKRMLLGRQYEIAASPAVRANIQTEVVGVRTGGSQGSSPAIQLGELPSETPVEEFTADYREIYRENLRQADQRVAELQATIDRLEAERDAATTEHVAQAELPAQLFEVYSQLVEADLDPAVARNLIEQVRDDRSVDLRSTLAVRARIARTIEEELTVTGPIAPGNSRPKIVALVGPTGVGKTTTIAKLAAEYRLKRNLRVGLITVDTYRIAAVDQLSTYAEIIDLPMEIVSTPLEMRAAVENLVDCDLILLDTAGRSPRDETKIPELQTVLTEASPDEVQLVLSAVSSGPSLIATVERFAPVGITSLTITKLDEAHTLGNVHTLAQASGLPLSYVTNGQNVPDDIRVAEPRELAMAILGMHAEFAA